MQIGISPQPVIALIAGMQVEDLDILLESHITDQK